MLPFADAPMSELPVQTDKPAPQSNKVWPRYDEIVSSLRKFYLHKFQHPVHIPIHEQQEMLYFCDNGPAEATPPAWIDWTLPNTTVPDVVETNPDATSAPVVRARTDVYRPFLAPRLTNARGRKCKCGSTTHLKVSHCECPLNPNRRPDDVDDGDCDDGDDGDDGDCGDDGDDGDCGDDGDDGDCGDDGDDDGEKRSFRFPLKTRVAMEFNGQVYAGQVHHIYDGEDLCEVVFTDGDRGDYDSDEIQYATELYAREFESHN